MKNNSKVPLFHFVPFYPFIPLVQRKQTYLKIFETEKPKESFENKALSHNSSLIVRLFNSISLGIFKNLQFYSFDRTGRTLFSSVNLQVHLI